MALQPSAPARQTLIRAPLSVRLFNEESKAQRARAPMPGALSFNMMVGSIEAARQAAPNESCPSTGPSISQNRGTVSPAVLHSTNDYALELARGAALRSGAAEPRLRSVYQRPVAACTNRHAQCQL